MVLAHLARNLIYHVKAVTMIATANVTLGMFLQGLYLISLNAKFFLPRQFQLHYGNELFSSSLTPEHSIPKAYRLYRSLKGGYRLTS